MKATPKIKRRPADDLLTAAFAFIPRAAIRVRLAMDDKRRGDHLPFRRSH
jgi:hypothetical protein